MDVGSFDLRCFIVRSSPGSVVLMERKERAAFVGDVLLAGSVGRADLPGGDYETLMRSIREKVLPLGDDVRVFWARARDDDWPRAAHEPVFGRGKRIEPLKNQ